VNLNGRASGDRVCWRALLALFLLLTVGAVAMRLGSRWQLSQIAGPSAMSDGRFVDQVRTGSPFGPSSVEQQRVQARLGQLPLSFEANQGQADPQVKFLARGGGYDLFLTGNEAVLKLQAGHAKDNRQNPGTAAVVWMRLSGANPIPRISATDELAGKSNYLIGNDPSKWHRNVPHFARIRYQDVYPGVDLVYYGRQGQLEYDFEVRAGTDPKVVQLSFEGQDKLVLDRHGDLLVSTRAGDARLHAPVIYQWIGENKKIVRGKFVLQSTNRAGFEIGDYDPSRSLVIDPTLSYSSYLGGSGNETSPSIAVDSSFDIYVAGQTTSPTFPGITGTPLKGPSDVFIAKLDPTGSSLIFATYLGGTGTESSAGIGVDSATNVYVAGTTDSTDFPTLNGFQDNCTGCVAGNHVFLTELKPDGSAPLYSTYLAGNGNETATGFALDSKGNAYVTGTTTSTNTQAGFPATANAFQLTSLATIQFFASKITPTSSGTASLAYSTYFGGGNPPGGQAMGGGIAVDSAGNMYFTGGTNFLHIGGSPAPANDFPILNAVQPSLDCPTNTGCPTNPTALDAFVAKINPSLTGTAGLLFSTYLGGTGDDFGTSIAVDTGNNVYVTGSTTSTDIPSPTGTTPFQTSNNGNTDAFVAKLNNPSTGSNIVTSYFSYLGGTQTDHGLAIVVDSTQIARVTGSTASADFPHPAGTFGGGIDAFVARVDTTSSATPNNVGFFLGGSGTDRGTGIALDTNFTTYVSGDTDSTNFPIAGTPLHGTAQGGRDAFVSKLGSVSDLAIKTPVGTSVTAVGVGNPVTFTYAIMNNGPDPTSGVTFTANLPTSGATFTSISASPGSCGSPAGSLVLCSIGTLLSSGTATVTEVLTPTLGSTFLNSSGSVGVTPSANPPSVDLMPGNNSASASVQVLDFTIGANPSSATVTAGTSAVYNVQVGPAGSQAFTNSVSLSCSAGLPQGTSCAFSTNPLTMTNTSPVSSQLTISTTVRPVTTTSLNPGSRLWYAALLPIFGLAFLGRGIGKSAAGRRWIIALLLGLVMTGVFFQAACGSGTKSTATVNPGTPAGTYNVTVTGTSGTASHGATVVLVVQ
jgi:uncharacterized repeat protein (TIGR01451 family)